MIQLIYQTAKLAYRSDIIYNHSLGWASWIGAALAGAPRVSKVVGDEAWERATNRRWYRGTLEDYQKKSAFSALRIFDWIRNLPLRAAKRVIVPSQYLSKIVQGWQIPEEKIEVIYNAVPSPTLTSVYAPPAELTQLVAIGRLVPWKGIDGILRALSGLSDSVHLKIIGDGPCLKELKQTAVQLEISHRVIFLGSCDHDTVLSHLQTSHLFILNSTYEGLPHVVLEAMQEGVPVIATRVGGTPEAVIHEQTGLLIEPSNDRELQDAITRLLTDNELRLSLVIKAKEKMESDFGFEKMVGNTLRVLRLTLQDSSPWMTAFKRRRMIDQTG